MDIIFFGMGILRVSSEGKMSEKLEDVCRSAKEGGVTFVKGQTLGVYEKGRVVASYEDDSISCNVSGERVYGFLRDIVGC